MKLALLSPHFDDAVLSCWQLLAGPGEVIVVNVFTAAPPVGTPAPMWDRLTGATDPVHRMHERRQEDVVALATVGRSSINLGLLDDQYREHAQSPAEVAELIERAVGPEVTLLAPGAFHAHPDHVLVRAAALELARRGRSFQLYADLPHAIRDGWPGWVTGAREGGVDVASHWEQSLHEAGIRPAELVARVRALDDAERARKLQALDTYRTQRAALDSLGFAPLADPRTLAWEVCWEVPSSALDPAHEVPGQALVADGASQALDDGV